MKYQYSILLFICLFGLINPRVFAQTPLPCNQRLITNADFSYTGGGTAPARWDVPQANAGGFSIDPAAYTYTASGNFSNQNVDWFNANSNLNNTAQYAIAPNPKDLSPQYADIPTDGMIVINPKQNQDVQYSQFQINNLLPLQTYYVEIKIYNVLALTSRASDNNCHSWCNWNNEISIKWEGNGNNAHDGQSNLTWTGSNGSGTNSGSWDAWGNQNSNMMWVAPGGAYAILKGQMTLGNATSGFTFTFSKKAETNPMVLGIDYIKIYGCQQEAINISGGTNNVCEASPFTLTAQGIGPPGSTYQWYENNVLLPGRTSDTLRIVSPTSPNVQTIYKAVGQWDTKSDTLLSRLCCSSVNGTSDEMLRESFNGLTYTACGAYGPYADIPSKNVINFIDPTYTYPSSATRCDLFDGQYAVVKSSYAGQYWKSPLVEVKDHTGVAGSGALFVNARGLKGSIFFSRNLPGLCASTTYEFSIWYASIAHVGEVEPNMEFDIMNGATVVASTTTGILTAQDNEVWKEATVTFTTPPSNVPTYTLQVINLVQSANGPPLYAVNGNDLMLDDIVVKKCTPGINVFQNGTTDSIVSVCNNNPVDIKVNTFYDLPLEITGSSSGTVYYQWMSSTSPTGPFGLLGTPETTGTFSAIPTATPTYYRAKVSADQTRAGNGQTPLATDCGNDAMTYSFKLTKGGNFSIPPASGTTAYCVGDPIALHGDAGTGVQWEWRKGTTFGGATVIAGYAYSTDVTKKDFTKTSFASTDAGTYYFVVKDAGGCETYDDLVVTANPVLTITPAAKAGDVCLKSTSQTTPLTYTATGAPTNYTITWDAAGITAGLVNVATTVLPASPISITVPANTAVGTYTGTIKVTKTGGCPSTGTTFTLTVNAPITPTFTAIPAVCQGGTAPTLPASSTNGINGTWSPTTVNTATVGTVIYNFTPAAGQCATAGTLSVTVTSPSTVPTFNTIPNVCQGATAPTLPTTSTNNITGTWSPATVSTATVGTTTYNFTPSAGQCAANGTLSVTVIAPTITPSFTPIANLCRGATAPTLPTTSNNSITGTWNPATVSTATAGTTTYNFTPTAGQCANPTSLSVTIDAPTIPLFTAIAAVCTGSTAPTLPATSNNGITGTWNPATVSTATAGTTSYTFTPDAGQCATTASLSVTVASTITPNFAPIPAVCVGATPPTLPATSTNNITGTWNPAIVSTATAGTTSYIFTPDAGQCATATSSLSVTVTAPATPNFAPLTAVCQGATAPTLPTTSTDGITGTWSPAVSTATVGTSSYTFTPTAGQCATTTTASLTVTAPTVPNFNAIPAVCQGATAPTLPVSSTQGITGSWSPATVSTATVGTTSYTFTPNPGQCAASTTLPVTVTSPSTVPNFAAMPSVCQGTTAQPLPTTSIDGISGTWSPALSTATVGTSTYTFTPNAGQCAATTTASVTVTAPSITPTFNAVPSVCVNSTPPILPTVSTNNITGTWSPAVSTTTVGTTSYTFTPNAGQCATTTTASVTITAPTITPTFNTVPSVCVNSTPPVLPTVSTNNITGTWSPAVSTTTVGTTSYTFTPNAGQCALTNTLSVTVTSPTPPTVSNVQYCQNDVALPLTATGANLTWYTLGGSTSVAPTPSTTVPRSTNYSVSSSDGTCESAKIPFVVTVKPITANAGGPIIRVEEGKPFQINGSATGNGMIVSWSPSIYLSSPSIPNPVITALNDRTYKMTVRTNDGCSATDDLQVIVLRTVEIPNAFSPNGDGINDTWQIKYLEDYTGATVSVFNRYGQFLFESPAGGYGAKPWDGTNKGSQVPVGTYFYIIKLGSGKAPLSGSVSVIR